MLLKVNEFLSSEVEAGDNPYNIHDAKLSSSATAHEIRNHVVPMSQLVELIDPATNYHDQKIEPWS